MQARRSPLVAILAVILVAGVCVSGHDSLSCNSCGDECTQSCGTRHFRTCCFNYLRKRSDPNVKPLAPESDYRNDLDNYAMATKSGHTPKAGHEQNVLADELKGFKDEQKARTQSFIVQLQRIFFGQISTFLYVQLLETRRFYDMMLAAADGHHGPPAAPIGGA